MSRLLVMGWMCGVFLVAGCGKVQETPGKTEAAKPVQVQVQANVQVQPQGQAQLTGQVSYLQRMALPPDAVLEVKLLDVSLADSPAKVLASQRISPTGQVPIAFTLSYGPSQIVPHHSYAVQARVVQGEQLLFISTQRYAVLTQGAPQDQIQVRVDPVAH